MDTARRGNKEVQDRIVILQKEKDHLTLEYRDKRKMVDDMKDSLQKKINEYSKIAESSESSNLIGPVYHLITILTDSERVLVQNSWDIHG